MNDCIFCSIVQGTAPCHKVWENEGYLAFLSIFPNTEGTTVVIPKKHLSSYIFEIGADDMNGLMSAAKETAQLLDARLGDVGRTALVFEGFGVDHLHAKLFPMHGTKDMAEWRPIESSNDKYFTVYEGYISSHDAGRADDAALAALAAKLRGENI